MGDDLFYDTYKYNGRSKGSKFGVKSSNNIRRIKLDFDRRDPDEYIVKLFGECKTVEDGGMVEGTKYSLNRKKRWLLVNAPDDKCLACGFDKVVSKSTHDRLNRRLIPTHVQTNNILKQQKAKTVNESTQTTEDVKRAKKKKSRLTKPKPSDDDRSIDNDNGYYEITWAPKKTDKRLWDHDDHGYWSPEYCFGLPKKNYQARKRRVAKDAVNHYLFAISDDISGKNRVAGNLYGRD